MIDINLNILNAAIGSFADDTRMWDIINEVHKPHTLQQNLNTVYSWAETNNMEFNDDKFEGIRFGHTNIAFEYHTPKGITITQNENVKDLGIVFEQSLLFSTHITNIVAKGHRTAGWALRVFKSRDTTTMLTLLKSLIISQVEYGCVLWSPLDTKHINLIERVQRQFTSKMAKFQTYDQTLNMPVCSTDYHERLRQLKLYSLERRRDRYTIIYIYKKIIGLVPNPGLQYTENIRTGIVIKPKHDKHAARGTARIRNTSFFVKGPLMYNHLPSILRQREYVTVPTKAQVEKFKKKLDSHLETIPDLPGTLANSLIPRTL